MSIARDWRMDRRGILQTTALAALALCVGAPAAMAEDGPVFELEADEGNFLVALGKVVYVKRSSRETQIGFGSTA